MNVSELAVSLFRIQCAKVAALRKYRNLKFHLNYKKMHLPLATDEPLSVET